MFFVIRLRKILLFLLIIVIIFSCCIMKAFIPTIATPVTNRVIIIDAGHGGFDPGAVGVNGTLEKDINLEIALKLQKLLEQNGCMTILTRTEDNSLGETKRIDMKTRKEIRDDKNADLFISIHLNSFPEGSCSGAQTFYANDEESKKLAETIQKNLKDLGNEENKRVAKLLTDVYLLKNVTSPSVIVECGFLSNSKEEEALKSEEYQSRLSWGIYFGILEYFESKANI